jgi:hypothetical protein
MWYNDVKIARRGGVMKDFLIFIVLFGLGALGIYFNIQDKNKKESDTNDKIRNAIKANVAHPTKQTILTETNSAIVYDQENNHLFIYDKGHVHNIKINDIYQSEIIEDGQTISKVSRSSQITGSIIGGAIAGSVGAIIGGVSATRVKDEKINKMELQLVVNDVNNPIRKVEFFNAGDGLKIKKSSDEYKVRYNQILEWQKLMEILIKQNENKSVSI